ncbi:MAG: N-acetylmuramoyl-L-alanine amidase [Betaproteobacteria bacterium]|nr:N-acetylmuramoyl-L-alanine amidase [Betaproteobacteria bacterium]
MKLVSRAEWGARPARDYVYLKTAELKGVAVHYSAFEGDRLDDHAGCAARVRGIQNYHMDVRGWVDLAYSFIVCRHGYVFEGRGFGVRTAANGTSAGNDGYHAVCFLGADREGRDDVTPSGRRALREIIRAAQRRWPAALEVRPHSDFTATACPGDELRAWIGLEGWKHDGRLPGPSPKPGWFWQWEAWRLARARGERPPRPLGVPRLIPPWAWLAALEFERRRRK